jgi:hypothetical protein
MNAGHDIPLGFLAREHFLRTEPDGNDLAMAEGGIRFRADVWIKPDVAAAVGDHEIGQAVAIEIADRDAGTEFTGDDLAGVVDFDLLAGRHF